MSSRKNILRAFRLLNDQELRNTFATEPVTVTTATRVAFNVATAGVTANTGTIAVQHRHYENDRTYSAWATLTLDATPTLADDDDTFLIDISVPPGQARLAFTQPTVETQTLTFPALADADDGDYIVITDGSGLEWAIALDTTGAAAAEPTGDAWDAVPAGRKDYVDVSGATTAAQVAALVETALDALTGLTAAVTTDDSANDGTMLLTMLVAGGSADPVPHNADDSDTGTITGVQTSGPDGTCDVWVTGAQEG